MLTTALTSKNQALNLGLFAHETLAYFTTLGKWVEVSPNTDLTSSCFSLKEGVSLSSIIYNYH